MKHKNRSRMRINRIRRRVAAAKQRPLSEEEQRNRAAENYRAHVRKYPKAPVYRNQDEPYDGTKHG